MRMKSLHITLSLATIVFLSRNILFLVQKQEQNYEIYLALPSLLPKGSKTLVSLRPRYVSNYPYNRKWRQLYTYQVSCYEAPRNGARHENSTVNYNASSPRTIMLPQYSFLATIGVALMGVRLQRVSTETTFTTRFSRACKQQLWSLSSSVSFSNRSSGWKKKDTARRTLATSRFWNPKRLRNRIFSKNVGRFTRQKTLSIDCQM